LSLLLPPFLLLALAADSLAAASTPTTLTNGCLVCMLTHPGRGVSTSGWYFQFFPLAYPPPTAVLATHTATTWCCTRQ
jgi:hypothetical protein